MVALWLSCCRPRYWLRRSWKGSENRPVHNMAPPVLPLNSRSISQVVGRSCRSHQPEMYLVDGLQVPLVKDPQMMRQVSSDAIGECAHRKWITAGDSCS